LAKHVILNEVKDLSPAIQVIQQSLDKPIQREKEKKMTKLDDRFYLPQPNQPFEGKVDTRIGTLEFSNQYPSKETLETLLDNMDFHGATQAYLWGIPITSNANLQHYIDNVFKVRQGELLETTTVDEKRGILTANATTPYIIGTVNLEKTGPFVIDVPEGKTGGLVDDFWLALRKALK
jgi:hypothetical protein